MREHEPGELTRIGQAHEMTPHHRRDERSSDGAGEKDQHGVENDAGGA